MFGYRKSSSGQQIGDVIEFDVDSHATAQYLAIEIEQQRSVSEVIIVGKTKIRVHFFQFHSDTDKQPVLDLMEVRGIQHVS